MIDFSVMEGPWVDVIWTHFYAYATVVAWYLILGYMYDLHRCLPVKNLHEIAYNAEYARKI